MKNNLEFIFTYKDLFKEIDDRLYFMIIFKVGDILTPAPKWVMGEIFLRKYLTLFNYETREIGFYKSKISTETKKNSSNYILLKIFCVIIIGIIVIYILFLFLRKYIKYKKVIADNVENLNSNNNKKENKNEVLLSEKNN